MKYEPDKSYPVALVNFHESVQIKVHGGIENSMGFQTDTEVFEAEWVPRQQIVRAWNRAEARKENGARVSIIPMTNIRSMTLREDVEKAHAAVKPPASKPASAA